MKRLRRLRQLSCLRLLFFFTTKTAESKQLLNEGIISLVTGEVLWKICGKIGNSKAPGLAALEGEVKKMEGRVLTGRNYNTKALEWEAFRNRVNERQDPSADKRTATDSLTYIPRRRQKNSG